MVKWYGVRFAFRFVTLFFEIVVFDINYIGNHRNSISVHSHLSHNYFIEFQNVYAAQHSTAQHTLNAKMWKLYRIRIVNWIVLVLFFFIVDFNWKFLSTIWSFFLLGGGSFIFIYFFLFIVQLVNQKFIPIDTIFQ